MDSAVDLAHLRQFGWIRIGNAVPTELCERLVLVLERELGVPVRDPSRWDEYGGRMRDFVPLWGHQAQWDIRQHPNFHRIWATLWNTEKLWVSLDSCRFTPPWKPGYAATYGIHWDHDPWDAKWRMLQGVLALTNTDVHQGGFRCVPALYHERDKWPKLPTIDPDGDANWLADTDGHEIVIVPARAGDLIVWDYRLPHGNSRNVSAVPRIAFYATVPPLSTVVFTTLPGAGGGHWSINSPPAGPHHCLAYPKSSSAIPLVREQTPPTSRPGRATAAPEPAELTP
jgi:hypothetical protein